MPGVSGVPHAMEVRVHRYARVHFTHGGMWMNASAVQQERVGRVLAACAVPRLRCQRGVKALHKQGVIFIS